MATWHREDAVRARTRHIASVFIRYGFGFLVRDLGLRRFFAFGSWGRVLWTRLLKVKSSGDWHKNYRRCWKSWGRLLLSWVNF